MRQKETDLPVPTPSQKKSSDLLYQTSLFLPVLLSLSVLLLAFFEAKRQFDPSTVLSSLLEKKQAHVLEFWDFELYNCNQSEFIPSLCVSVTGPDLFRNERIPLRNETRETVARMQGSYTHMILRYPESPTLKEWITMRESEEYLRPQVVFYDNSRCFESTDGMRCRRRTESLPFPSGKLEFIFQVAEADLVGPRSLSPILHVASVESQLLSMENLTRAAFSTEVLVTVLTTTAIALLLLLYPQLPFVRLLVLIASVRSLSLVSAYVYESLQPEWLLSHIGPHVYSLLLISCDVLILGGLLALAPLLHKRQFCYTRLEIAYILSITMVFVMIAGAYGGLQDLAQVSHFFRDTMGALFSSIFVIYQLFWGKSDPQDPELQGTNSHLVIFLFLFFVVAHGAASAQSALSLNQFPQLLAWETLFFLPGLTATAVVLLRAQLPK